MRLENTAPCWPNRARPIVVDFVGTLLVGCGESRAGSDATLSGKIGVFTNVFSH